MRIALCRVERVDDNRVVSSAFDVVTWPATSAREKRVQGRKATSNKAENSKPQTLAVKCAVVGWKKKKNQIYARLVSASSFSTNQLWERGRLLVWPLCVGLF